MKVRACEHDEHELRALLRDGGLVQVSGGVNGGTIDTAPALQRRGFRVQ